MLHRISLIVCVALSISACLSPLRFGAEDFKRVADTGGVPTYHASGHLDRDETGEAKAAKVMHDACPGGNPKLIDGLIMSMEVLPRRLWNATFTCDRVIPGV